MGLEEKAEARERRGPENGVQDVFFFKSMNLCGQVRSKRIWMGLKKGCPGYEDTLK